MCSPCMWNLRIKTAMSMSIELDLWISSAIVGVPEWETLRRCAAAAEERGDESSLVSKLAGSAALDKHVGSI